MTAAIAGSNPFGWHAFFVGVRRQATSTAVSHHLPQTNGHTNSDVPKWMKATDSCVGNNSGTWRSLAHLAARAM